MKLFVASATWKVRWHMVPYRWLLASNNVFDKCLGKVNQNEWEGFEPGTALLVAVGASDPYTQSFPEMVDWNGTEVPSQDKLVDIELTILEKDPPVFETYTPTNLSHIARGHNLLPYGKTGKWYYGETRGESGVDPTPNYASFPYEFLFMNPDGVPL